MNVCRATLRPASSPRGLDNVSVGGGLAGWPVSRVAFSLIEVLVVIVIMGVLSAVLLPALSGGKQAAQRVKCASNLRQLGVAAQMYFDDNDGLALPYQLYPTNHGVVYWFGWIENGAEGARAFDAKLGPLYPYVQGRGIEICPSLNYAGSHFKSKARGAAYGYGYNRHLSPGAKPPINTQQIQDISSLALFADAAQINDFQVPASPEHPMLEEFYYVDAGDQFSYPNAHFRHQQRANVVFLDGHIDRESPAPHSIDPRLPRERVGRLRAEILKVPLP